MFIKAKSQLAHVTLSWCSSAGDTVVFSSQKPESQLLFSYILNMLVLSLYSLYYLHLYVLFIEYIYLYLYECIYIHIWVKKNNYSPSYAVHIPSMYVGSSH